MGKLLNPENALVGRTQDESSSANTDPARRILTGDAAEQLHTFFTRPAGSPTPEMLRAIETYRRMMAIPRSK